MRVAKFHTGISILENGGQVLTPFSRFGSVYRYSELLYRRLMRQLDILRYAAIAVMVVVVLLVISSKISTKNLVEIFIAFAAISDLLRYGWTKAIFRRALLYPVAQVFSDDERKSLVFANLGAAQLVQVGVGFFEAVIVVGLIFDAIGHREIMYSSGFAVPVMHAIIYGFAWLRVFNGI